MCRFGKWLAAATAAVMMMTMVAGCSAPEEGKPDETTGQAQSTLGETEETTDSGMTEAITDWETIVRVGSLKGPTSMGLVSLMDLAAKGNTVNTYEFRMETAADVVLAAMIKGELDIALVPANVASVLYNRTKGEVVVIDINTLGVLYVVAADDSIKSMADLAGKTIYLTGKGTSPDFVLRYLLAESGVTDVKLEFKSEAAEVVSAMAADPAAIGLLPQPFATVASAKNENLKTVLDLTAEWDALQGEGGSRLVTGVTVVRKAFLAEHEAEVQQFLREHKASAAFANEHVSEAAELVAAAGIIEKAAVAAKAMPFCNITYIDGEEMQAALAGYLRVLFEQDAASVGGTLPGDDFYYAGLRAE